MCAAGGKVLEQSTDWRCDANQHQDDWRHSERDSLGVPGSQALWRDLAEDQDHDSQHPDGDPGAHASKRSGRQNGRERRGTDVNEIVAN